MLLQVFLVSLLFPILRSFWIIADDLNTDAHKSELENNVAIAIMKIGNLFITILLVLISHIEYVGLVNTSKQIKKKRRDCL